jgi:hypothetical protein
MVGMGGSSGAPTTDDVEVLALVPGPREDHRPLLRRERAPRIALDVMGGPARTGEHQ